MDTTFKMNPAVKATVKVNSKIRFGFRINGGGSPTPPEPPEPDPGVAVIAGTPILIVNRASFGDEPLYGTPILVEE